MQENSSAGTTPLHDVVVIGGGMVGATLATALQRLGSTLNLRVLVIEPAQVSLEGQPAQPSFDARSTAISYGSSLYLQQLGLWSALDSHACPIAGIHVSDRGRFGAVRMNCQEQGVEALGYVLENAVLGAELNRSLRSSSSVDLWDLSRVVDIRPARDCMALQVEREKKTVFVRGRLVVLAEGGLSGLSSQLGITRHEKEYGQTAIITNVSFERDHAQVAYERFTRNGPIALLPLNRFEGQNRSALVWTCAQEEAANLMALDEKAFLSELQKAFGNRLGRFCRAGERHNYSLSLWRAEELYRRGLVLLGNVAQTLHPVAGQGFNLAMRNAMALAQSIIEASRQQNPGQLEMLSAYGEKIGWDQQKTIAFSDYMTQLFSSDNWTYGWVRKFGMFSVDLLPPLKRAFVRQGMGLGEPMVQVSARTDGRVDGPV